MDISRYMTYTEQIEDEKIRDKSRDFKKARVDGDGFSNQRSRSGGNRRIQGGQRHIRQGPTNTLHQIFNKEKGKSLGFKEVVQVLKLIPLTRNVGGPIKRNVWPTPVHSSCVAYSIIMPRIVVVGIVLVPRDKKFKVDN